MILRGGRQKEVTTSRWMLLLACALTAPLPIPRALSCQASKLPKEKT